MGLDRALPYDLSRFPKGERNLLTDVPGVLVGHHTVCDAARELQTGVTAILPCADSPYDSPLPAAVHVMNGYGKSVGLMQVEELGTLETPILLTNTLSVGMASHALVRHMLKDHPEIGLDGTVNPVVMECNDGGLSDIRALAITEEHVFTAIAAAGESFAEGDVGAGRGMICFGLKGGIGSASRRLTLDAGEFHLGCLVLTNFGMRRNLMIFGEPVGRKLEAIDERTEKGSIIVLLATDLPLTSRQLKRLCKRAEVGIIRTGGYIGHGSGEVALAFSTANRLPRDAGTRGFDTRQLAESAMDGLFEAVASVVEESVLSSLEHAQTVVGRAGRIVPSLAEALQKLEK